jgi:DNA-binding PucR family transcriptional regulator
VREILRVAKDRDADVAAWLEVIDQFDHAVAARSSLEELVRLAGDITGVAAGVRDDWSRVRAEAVDGVLTTDEAAGLDVARAATRERLRGRTATEVETGRGRALVSCIEAAAGRIGMAWLLAPDMRTWEPTDHLVVERLGGAVASRALETRKRRAHTSAFDPAAVERLLCEPLSDDELARATRQAKLSASDRYVAIALAQPPAGELDAEELATLAAQAISEQGLAARAAVVASRAAVVARAGEALGTALDELAGAGSAVHLGVGDAVPVAGLAASWGHALEALALRPLVAAGDAPAYFEALGSLHLLAQIPRGAVQAAELVRHLDDPDDRGSPSDVEVLEAYLEEGTLRRAGERVFLHHTTVQHRLKGIEQRLGVDLREPMARFRVQLAIRLLAIDRATAG